MELWEGSRVLTPKGRKQRGLLAMLALAEGRPVPPMRLIDGIWGIDAPRDAAHALQAQVSRLRKALPVGLSSDERGYRLDASEIEVDAIEFAARAARGSDALTAGRAEEASKELREALQLWRGPALAELSTLPGLRAQAVRLDELHTKVRGDRVKADLASGKPHGVIGELESLVAVHPMNEHLWALLALALYRAGRQVDSLNAYHRARAALLDVGVEPGRELDELHQRVLRHDASLAGPVPPALRAIGGRPTQLPPEIAGRAHGPFVGREAALDRMTAAWEAMGSGSRLVLVTGEAGIGKTRVAAELARTLHSKGTRVLFGRCDDALSVPYQPFVEMLRSDVGAMADMSTSQVTARLGPHPGDLTRLLPQLAASLPGAAAEPLRSDADTERYRLFEAVAGWLGAASSHQPMLLVIDDLQWATTPTLLMLRHLVRTSSPLRCLIVATCRMGEPGAGEPLDDLVADLHRDRGVVTQLPLRGLSSDAIGDLIATELRSGFDHEVADDLAARVHVETGGNAFFVMELVRHLADGGSPPGLGPLPRADVPEGVKAVIEQRLRLLEPTARAVLDIAAIIGRRFDVQVVRAVTETEPDALDVALRSAIRAGLIDGDHGAGLHQTFVHDLVRATLYDAIPPLRRIEGHRRVAEALEQLHLEDLPAHVNELAHHFTVAAADGRAEPAIGYLALAGDAALEQRAPAEAVDHYQRALELLGPQADTRRRCDLLIALGKAQLDAGDSGHRSTLLAAGRVARRMADPARLARAAITNTRGWFSDSLSIDHERVDLLEAALAVCDDADRPTRTRLMSRLATEAVTDPNRRLEAVDMSAEAVTIARGLGDPDLLASTLSKHCSVVMASFTDPRGCASISGELVDLARGRPDPALGLSASLDHCQTTLLVGDLETSDRYLHQAERQARAVGHPARMWLASAWRAMRLGLRGRFRDAESAAEAAFELGSSSGQPDAATWFAGQLFTLRWQQGRLHELVDMIEAEVDSAAEGIPAWRTAYALALAEAGRLSEAEAILDEFLSTGLRDLPQDLLWLQGMAFLCSTCELVGRPDAAVVLHAALAPYHGLLASNGAIGAGPTDVHLGAMSLLAGEQERAAAELMAAEEMCLRIDAPVWLERTRSLLALAG